MVSMEINVAYCIFRDSDVLPTYECDLILICLIVYVYFINLSAETNSIGKKKSIIYNELRIAQIKTVDHINVSQVYH